MKQKTFVVAGAILSLAVLYALAQPEVSPVKTLGPGTYSAKLKALVCDACAPEVKQTLGKQNGIGDVSVDQKTSTVLFTVKEDAKVKLSDVQKALDASSADMGMGADYTLYDVKKKSRRGTARSA
jgi:copper chaperone CopZ